VASAPLRLLVLGDSIAYGTGARRADDTLGRRLSAALTAEGFHVDLHVHAVPGALSVDLAAQVRRAQRLDADLALVVIGANDLARLLPPEQAAGSLAAAVATLRSRGTDVVVVPAPDMSSVPFVPPAFRPLVQAACAELQRRQAAVAEAAGAWVADIAAEVGRAFVADPAMFSGDRFHPSSAGYARIAAALAPTVVAAARDRRDREPAA
jgi:lysophospholipase L1-like esterase